MDNKLEIAGTPVWLFDNGGKTFDRYTLISPKGDFFGFSESPFGPNGFCQYCGDWGDLLEDTIEEFRKDEKEITDWEQVPTDIKKACEYYVSEQDV